MIRKTHNAQRNVGAARERRYAVAMVFFPVLGAGLALLQMATRGVNWLELALLLGMYLLTGFGVEVGLHRFFSHRAFKASPWLTAWFGITGSMAGQGPILFWVSVHRRHHAFTDKADDPHSPHLHGTHWRGRLLGFAFAHVGWMFRPAPPNASQFVRDLLRQRRVLWLHQHYLWWVALGLALPALLGGLIAGSIQGVWSGFLWGGLVRIFLVAQATSAINSFAHTFGQRPSSTRDRSGNLPWLAMFTLGGGWHNNHHAHPGLARTGILWWQLDPSGWLIERLAWLGWASEVRQHEGALTDGIESSTNPVHLP